MARLIDADALKMNFPHDEDWNYPVNTNQYVSELIDSMPTVELIRCKDCMHETDNDCPIKWGKTGEDFCLFAERKEE